PDSPADKAGTRSESISGTNPLPAPAAKRGASHVEAEVEDVAVLDDVVLAFGPHLAGLLGALLSVASDEGLIGYGFGPDEAALEIRVNDACRFGSGRAAAHGPGAGLLRPHGEEGHEVKEAISGADHPGEPRLLEVQSGEEFALLFGAGEVCYLGFDGSGDDD